VTAPSFSAPGARGAIACHAATALLAITGMLAPAASRLLGGRRYRRLERAVLRLAWRGMAARERLVGLEHARGGPFVVMPLHESLVDPLLLTRLPLPLRYVARDEIWAWRYFGPALCAGGHFPLPASVRRSELRRLVEWARAGVAGGESVVVFPQGSVLGVEIAFQRGAFWLASELGVEVLPVVITGTHGVWEYPFSTRLRRRQPVRLEVLPPMGSGARARDRRALERRMRIAALLEQDAAARRFIPSRDGFWDGYEYEVAPEFEALAEIVRRHRVERAPSRA
jgi:1-acyl-sn-glycerol-3-phosphate acyltransferase